MGTSGGPVSSRSTWLRYSEYVSSELDDDYNNISSAHVWRIVPWISFRFLGWSIESHFFPALDLYDFRIMDDDFHRTETQLFQRLLNGLFYAVKRIVLHDGLSPFVPC